MRIPPIKSFGLTTRRERHHELTTHAHHRYLTASQRWDDIHHRENHPVVACGDFRPPLSLQRFKLSLSFGTCFPVVSAVGLHQNFRLYSFSTRGSRLR